ncbi:MAG: 3'-5' exonuclease [Thermomicrobiales bacterium]
MGDYDGSGPGGRRPGPGRTDPAGSPRDAAIHWARDVTSDRATLYLDTETTGIGKGAEIIEISIINGDGAVLLDTLVRPVGAIDPGAQRVHGIGIEHLHDAPAWPPVHDTLCQLIRGQRVVVYNAAFDKGLVDQCGRRHGLTTPVSDWHCAMLKYAALKQQPGRYPGQYRWHKLEHAAASFGTSPGGHRALSDARACRVVVLGMAHTPTDSEQ